MYFTLKALIGITWVILLQIIVAEHEQQNQAVVLETSNPRNFAFYEPNGFHEITTITDTGYTLMMF
jgi:hypothetical protein